MKVFEEDETKTGAGGYLAGNPGVDFSWGGGAGCHFQGAIDQTDAYNSEGQNLVGDASCECNYAFKDDWGQWVSDWINHAQPKAGFEGFGWFQGGLAPSWALDIAACWVNNPRDMINIQNALFWSRSEWNNRLIPHVDRYSEMDAAANRPYWGWNEVPVDREQITDSGNWDAVMVKLPAALCRGENGELDSLACLGYGQQLQLETDLRAWVEAGKLSVGRNTFNIEDGPKSSIVVARELMDDNGNYFRYFFCEPWSSPNQLFQIVFEEGSACYVDRFSVDV